MSRRLAFAVAVSLVVVAAVSGNAGPARLPKDHKRIDPPVRFEGIEKHSEYVFHVQCGGAYLSYRTFQVKDAKSFPLDFPNFKDRAPTISYMVLLAMKRQDFEKRAKADPKLEWLTEKTEGVLSVKLAPPSLVAPVTVKEIPVTTYRVTIKDGKLTAEKVAGAKSSAAPPASLLPNWAFGLVGSASVAWLGLWFVRRRPATPPPQEPA